STKELHSAFSNLVTNAVRYTPAGGRIAVEFRREGDGAVLAVRDSGYGIPASHLPRLTERFYRVSSSRSRESGGTGLGLSISDRLVRLMSGELQVVSEPGLGSSFSVELPLPPAPADPQQSPAPQLPAGLQVQVRGSVRELVQSLCERLQQRGAQASVYREDSTADLPSPTVLLDLVLDDPLPGWAGGPRVVACREGGVRPR
ncbi:ATP-binding protein, partial [Enterobacter hormaechei]|uniref:ATP-binding protein n=1 Tax=Enterobacter hormaechei TaxID=158836 RepID=UPI00200F64CC